MNDRDLIISTTGPDGRQTKLFNTWRCMLKRCYNPNESMYHRYGGRGILVCDEWLGADGFQAFAADMGEPSSREMTLDRIDGNGHYCKENCRWATRTEQNRNTARNRLVEVDGVSRCLSEWSEISKISEKCIAKRLRRGWPAKEAVFTPDCSKGVRKRKRYELAPQVGVSPVYRRDPEADDFIIPNPPNHIPELQGPWLQIDTRERLLEIDGVWKPMSLWMADSAAPRDVVKDRLTRGWDPKSALFTPSLGIGKKRHGIRKKAHQP